MATKLTVLRTNGSKTEAGVIAQRKFSIASGATTVEKKPGEAAPFHNPDVPVLLTVISGSHTIVFNDGHDHEIRLQAGDQILFCDFKPGPGHRSTAGPEGAVLLPAKVPTFQLETETWEPVIV